MHLPHTAVVVIGGASGLGAATAEMFARTGSRVTIIDVNETDGAQFAKQLNAPFVKADICNENELGDALAIAKSYHGAARIMVNCVGVGIAKKTISNGKAHDLEAFKRIIDINLTGAFNCIRLFAQDAVKLTPVENEERAVIISAASIAAYDGQIGQAAYAASKAGLTGMTLPVARDLADHGIRVCAIAPGLFNTPALAQLPEDMLRAISATIPFPKRLGEPEEFAQAVQFICETKALNGEVIRLDGALRMAPR